MVWLSNKSILFTRTELFDNFMQQDAHEFLNYLLNTIADILVEEKKQAATTATPVVTTGRNSAGKTTRHIHTARVQRRVCPLHILTL
jgi:uncharacterized UBP type Zn finger protein